MPAPSLLEAPKEMMHPRFVWWFVQQLTCACTLLALYVLNHDANAEFCIGCASVWRDSNLANATGKLIVDEWGCSAEASRAAIGSLWTLEP